MTVSTLLRTSVALAFLGTGFPARAQTAEQYNRAAQAIQICSSAMGAMVPECASLRGGLGAPAARAGANPMAGLAGANSSAAGLLGIAAQALAASRSQAVAQPAPQTFASGGFPSSVDASTSSALATQAAAQSYQACVMRVGPANTAGVQGCIAQLQSASGGYPAPAGFPQPGGSAASPLAPAAMNAFSAMLGR